MDRRYTAPDGSEVEAWQLTETSRYAQKEWPDWLDSRWFLTVDNETWLDLNGREIPLPDYSWITWNGVQAEVVNAMAFEGYVKVVQEAPAPDPQAQEALPPTNEYSELMSEILVVLELDEADGDALAELKKVVAKRVTWCACAPGMCEGGDRWSCRQNSPLAQ
jgi:hypothetical protein